VLTGGLLQFAAVAAAAVVVEEEQHNFLLIMHREYLTMTQKGLVAVLAKPGTKVQVAGAVTAK
jgi:hypothetical protein